MFDFMKPRRSARLSVIVAVFLTAIGLSALLVHKIVWAEEAAQTRPAVALTPAAPLPAGRNAALLELENAFTSIAERIDPSVVSIRVQRTMRTGRVAPDIDDFFRQFELPGAPDTPGAPRLPRMPRTFRMEGSGSGVIVRSDGWILTNDHVVDEADKVTVKLHDGREFTGTVRRDFRGDIALVKIPATGLTPAEFGDSDKVRVGQWAIAFGAPFELADTMTVGIISARHRQTQIGGIMEGRRFYPDLIQTDAAINPGNSGGPLLDINGRVIGINVAINSMTGGNVGVGFAIPSNTAQNIMNQLITSGKVVRGFLGIVPRALTPSERARYGVATGGALVESVQDNTPASRAGLQVEDVITRFDGVPVTDDIQFRDLVARAAPGKQVTIVVRRGDRDTTLTTRLETVPEPAAQAERERPAETPGGKLGARVEPVTPENAKKYNLDGSLPGVVVTQVQPGSPAEDAGIQPGDVILRANGRAVRTAADLNAAFSGIKSGDSATLVLYRDKNRSLVTVQMP